MIYFCILINKRIIFAKNLKKRSHLHVVPGITVFKGFIQEIIAWGPPHSGILSTEKKHHTNNIIDIENVNYEETFGRFIGHKHTEHSS